MVTCHLGHGASVTALRGGRSVDISMSLTPLEGLVMGTRSGDLDPGLVLYLIRGLGMSVSADDELLNDRSGLLGVSGLSSDVRDLSRRRRRATRPRDWRWTCSPTASASTSGPTPLRWEASTRSCSRAGSANTPPRCDDASATASHSLAWCSTPSATAPP